MKKKDGKMHWVTRYTPVAERSTLRGMALHVIRSGGFTLVETLLAIAILTMAVIAPLSIASQGLSAATTGKDRFIATALAREAIEYIRNVRDTNRILNTDFDTGNDVDWLAGLNACRNAQCVVDTLASNQNVVKITSRGSYGVLKVDTGTDQTGLYGISIGGCNGNAARCWSDSRFTRYATITDVIAGREVRVTATVTWLTLFSTKKVEMSEQLVNW